MDYRSQLLTLCSAYCAARSRSEARIATVVAGRSNFFAQIREGRTCTVDMYLHVQRWFGEHWPEGVAWPDGVDRPGTLPQSDSRAA